jgi:hypothetical protein
LGLPSAKFFDFRRGTNVRYLAIRRDKGSVGNNL